jgi:hypothetical protein
MTRKEQAIKSARLILNTHIDPNGEECVLAQQFLRLIDREAPEGTVADVAAAIRRLEGKPVEFRLARLMSRVLACIDSAGKSGHHNE